MKLQVGDAAPEFTLPDQNNSAHSLSDYRGQYLLLYFYPEDETPGCVAEACSIRDNFSQLREKMEVVGVSADSVESHKKFAQHHQLPFTLLADPEKVAIKAYGADGFLFSKRCSFLIDPHGKIARIYEHVKPEEHVAEVLADIAQV